MSARPATVIVDYGVGNIGSIQNMLRRIGVDGRFTADPAEIAAAERLILPGVGAFDPGMRQLEASGLVPLLNERVLEARVPVLGICLGMQLLTRGSEEGGPAGLGWIDADTVRFPGTVAGDRLRVPHMGWNTVRWTRESALRDGLEDDARFYFVHSYHVRAHDPADALAVARHGVEFAAIVERGNICGAQFHPEKSHRFGMRLLQNFIERAA